jgi:lipoprotein-anchoring transpeptidase ErfK/SrfK
MKRLRFLVVLLPALAFLCGATGQALAAVLIVIDKPSQTMTVAVNGAVQYRWYVSTGATGYSTPGGSYTPFRLERMHYSREWDNAGMPHSIFFTSRGHAIHGSDHPGRGSPRSHGCVRLSLPNAATLFQLVSVQGMANTKVVVRGSDPPGYHAATQIPTRKRAQQQGPFQKPFSFFPF